MRPFFSLIKPGIIAGNLITLSGGYVLGTTHPISTKLLTITMLGMALVMACGCTLNNYIDRDIDALMQRTKNRVLVRGLMSNQFAVVLAFVFGLLGLLLLYFQTNALTLSLALLGLVSYVMVYSLWFKRHSVYGTFIGGIAGAMPPVVGYCAVTNRFDSGAWLLFFILFLWQIPHFYAIAIYRQEDYQMADIPVLPIKKGILCAKIHMACYIMAFTIVAIMPTFLGYVGYLYLTVALICGLLWFYVALRGFVMDDDKQWARKMFLISLIVITLLFVMMIVGR